MTSETGVETGWSCGWNSLLNELGRIAILEYPVNSVQSEQSSRSSHSTHSRATPLKKPAPTETTLLQQSASTMPGPRLSFPRPAILRPNFTRSSPVVLRPISTSTPVLNGWTGRTPEDHAVNRDGKDVQSEQSQQGMKEKDDGSSPSNGISEKGGENQKKAEGERPQAPKPVIGMNDERGGKGH